MRVLITGGTGFIGSHLADRALQEGWQVCVYDKARETFRGEQKDIRYIYGDLYKEGVPPQALSGRDVVFHLACTTIHETSNQDPVFDIESNLLPAVKLFQQCVRAGVRKVVFLSSGGTVYGIPRELPVRETHPTEPICSYGIHKLAIEKYLSFFHRFHGLDHVALRPSNPYGERQNFNRSQGALTVFLSKLARHEPITIWGDGSVVRDHFYVGDLVQACLDAAVKDTEQRILNVGSGTGFSLNQLVERIEAVLGVKARVVRRPDAARRFDVPALVLDVSEAKRELSWEPRVSLEEGIARTWRWILGVVS
jgi:UDP-glucose 4-epimerase